MARASDLFLELMANVDPSTNVKTEILIDTNVALETLSFSDLFREGDKHGTAGAAWRAPEHRYRQLRAKHSIVLAWVLSQRGTAAGMLGQEVLDLLTSRLSPAPSRLAGSLVGAPDGTAFTVTAGIVTVIRPMLLARGLRLGVLTEVDHRARGSKADAELFKLARRDSLAIITNEGYSSNGLSDLKADGTRNLRGECHDERVTVYTPEEYLTSLRVDVDLESGRFLEACEHPVIEAYIAAANAGAGLLRVIDEHLEQHPESQGWLAMLEQLIPLYRLVLLDDVAEELRHIPPPTLRRAAEGPDVVTGLRLPAPRVRGRPANARASR